MVIHSVERTVDDYGIDYSEYPNGRGKYNISMVGVQVLLLLSSLITTKKIQSYRRGNFAFMFFL